MVIYLLAVLVVSSVSRLLQGLALTKILLYSVPMVTLCVQPVNQEYITVAQHVGRSWGILGAWHWKKLQSHLTCLASIAHSVAHRSFHTFASSNMNLSAVSDHIIVLMRDLSAQ